jgi:hypothetical protein
LPEGDIGLRTPQGGGPVAAEQSYSVLSDGSFYVVYRTIDGHPVMSYSRDGGKSWELPQYKRYANGRLMKHPRAANFAWKCSNGNYLYWFHNHGGRFIREHPGRRSMAYRDRNPVWLAGDIEADSPQGKIIKWAQPEIVLYDDDPKVRMSYPDLVEDDGCYLLTETQIDITRVHEIDPGLLAGLWSQFDNRTVTQDGLLLSLPESRDNRQMPARIEMPLLPEFLGIDLESAHHGTKNLQTGFSVELWFQIEEHEGDQILLDSRTVSGKGFCLRKTKRGAIEIVINDGRTENRWHCDPDLLQTGAPQHVVVIVDGGPRIITFVVNGVLDDGGNYRQFGWGRFSPNLRSANGDDVLRIAPDLPGLVKRLRIYNRHLTTSEAVANFRAGS